MFQPLFQAFQIPYRFLPRAANVSIAMPILQFNTLSLGEVGKEDPKMLWAYNEG